ncbi:MAG TPA: amidase [Mycobacteriales bacterium]|nr:amidase [Mycobacteriales bacterium]
MPDLHDLSALEQARLVRSREVSPVDLVDHYLDRVERLSDGVGAFVTVTADAARAAAKTAERAVTDGMDVGPLHGVPTAIKDLNLTAGVATTLGSKVFAGWVPELDDHVVTRLRAAGTISLGKTSTPEFGLPCYTEPDVAPPARTPWDLSRSAGGSSGGAAAAVAAGLLPFAQGSDGGGSIRIPASACGLFGIKPSRGRVSNGPLNAEVSGLAVMGPLARTVRDAAAMLDAMAGPMPGDPFWAAPPATSFLAAADRAPGRLRVGRYADPVLGHPLDPQCRAAYDGASALLETLGHEVVDIPRPYGDELLEPFKTVWSVSAAGVPVPPEGVDHIRALTRALRDRGLATSAVEFNAAMFALRLASRQAIVATSGYDAVLTPTLAQLPRAVGGFRNDADPWADFDDQVAFTPFTAPYNMSGQPAVSVPLHWTPDGLPVGVQLVGRPADEVTLVALSAQLEAARPWADRRPPMW